MCHSSPHTLVVALTKIRLAVPVAKTGCGAATHVWAGCAPPSGWGEGAMCAYLSICYNHDMPSGKTVIYYEKKIPKGKKEWW